MAKMNVAVPRLPQFSLTPEMIEYALSLPISDKIRRELVLPVDEKRPNAWNRIIATGLAQFSRETGLPEAMLIRMLLVLYFTGNLNGGSGAQPIAFQFDQDTEDEYDGFENSDDEYIDGDAFDHFPGA